MGGRAEARAREGDLARLQPGILGLLLSTLVLPHQTHTTPTPTPTLPHPTAVPPTFVRLQPGVLCLLLSILVLPLNIVAGLIKEAPLPLLLQAFGSDSKDSTSASVWEQQQQHATP